MEKTAAINVRVNPVTKKRAEDVLGILGIPMSTAIEMYLRQISLTGSIPFQVCIPDFPREINMDLMSAEEIHERLDRGYQDAVSGNVVDARKSFEDFRRAHFS